MPTGNFQFNAIHKNIGLMTVVLYSDVSLQKYRILDLNTVVIDKIDLR